MDPLQQEPELKAPKAPALVNVVRGEVEAKLGDHTFVLVPSFENIASIEQNLGRSFLKIVAEFRQGNPNLSFQEAATMLFIAQKDPKLSYAKIGGILATGKMFVAVDALTKYVAICLETQGNAEAGPTKS